MKSKSVLLVSVIAIAVIVGALWFSRSANTPTVPLPTQAENITRKDFGGWALECNEEAKRCVLFQGLSNQETKKRVGTFTIGNFNGGHKILAVATGPLGILVPSGMAIRVDEHEQVHFPIHSCSGAGCQGLFELEEKTIKAMISGRFLRLGFMSVDQKSIAIPFTLEHFGDAWASLQEEIKKFPAEEAEKPASNVGETK